MTAAEHDRIPEAALAWIDAGKRAALATVVRTWGSAPRPVGAQLAISSEAELAGSVSGGCVEGAVAAEALEALQDGRPRLLEFGVADADAFAVGLACGGAIHVLVEPIGVGDGPLEQTIRDLAAARAKRRQIAYVVCLDDWSRLLVDRAAGCPLGDEVRRAMDADASGFAALEDGRWFVGVHNPPLRLVIVGAVHIAQPLRVMAEALGYDVTIVDPRDAFAAEARFPGARLSHAWPDAGLDEAGLDARTAVVTLTHDPKLDDPAIMRALRSDAFYLGCLGSRKTHAARVERLRAAGFADAEIARIHAPLGLDIGAKSPAEIALSALGQITERLRRPETRPGSSSGTAGARDAAA
ncbi:XdhC family protein [Rubrimonas sp.]|uniref:XdhC family protein n=1 Tax=Rubrimonas sp. TaxID=2036015 RepID=UPI002FDE8D43